MYVPMSWPSGVQGTYRSAVSRMVRVLTNGVTGRWIRHADSIPQYPVHRLFLTIRTSFTGKKLSGSVDKSS